MNINDQACAKPTFCLNVVIIKKLQSQLSIEIHLLMLDMLIICQYTLRKAHFFHHLENVLTRSSTLPLDLLADFIKYG